MNDIFISYAQEDRERADLIAYALQKHGWTVWWDRKIPIGKTFEEVIETHISSAKCVMVLWSRHSVKSHWVREEANDGQTRSILAPVLLDEIPIPLGFKRIQAANLIKWTGDANAPVFISLVNDIKSITGIDKVNIDKNNITVGETKSRNLQIEADMGDADESMRLNVYTDDKSSNKTQPAHTTLIDHANKNLLSFTEVYCHTSQPADKNSFEEGQLTINSDFIQYISTTIKITITNVQNIYFQIISEGFSYNYMVVEHQIGSKTEKLMFSIYSFWGGEPTRNMYLKVYDLYTSKQLPYIKKMQPY